MTRNRAGLTLLEVLLTMVLVAVLAGTVVTLLPNILHLNQRSSQDQQVTADAKAFFENLRSDWASRAVYDAGTMPTSPPGCTSSATGDLGGYRRVSLTCSDFPGPFVVELGAPGT